MPLLYSAASEYAVRALVNLASHPARECVGSKEIAREENIPGRYLATILKRLVNRRILLSSKGPSGGFALGLDPGTIRLLDVVNAIDGISCDEHCAMGYPLCSIENPCAMHDSWQEVRRRISEYLQCTTIADLARARFTHRMRLNPGPPQPGQESRPCHTG